MQRAQNERRRFECVRKDREASVWSCVSELLASYLIGVMDANQRRSVKNAYLRNDVCWACVGLGEGHTAGACDVTHR